MEQILDYNTYLVPGRFFYKDETFRISRINNDYIVTNYKIYLVDGYISKVIINAKHPNANPDTGELCLDEKIKRQKYDEKFRQFIEMVICNFYLDDCYFKPWLDFSWEEYDAKSS